MPDYRGRFTDRMVWDGEQKTAISIRDGVLEYYGHELGMTPATQLFTVFRSPATIANAADKMKGIPLTDGHVEVGSHVSDRSGTVVSGEMIDHFDEYTDSKLAVKNTVALNDGYSIGGNRELSLGYDGDLIPHDKYDFEQKNIVPHHLAVVSAGRCGSSCSFIDKKPEVHNMPDLHKVFADAEGQPNLQEIVEIAQALPEALKTVPLDKLQELVPSLKEVIASAGMPAEEVATEDVETTDADAEEEVESVEATDADAEEEVEKVPMQDSNEFKDAIAQAAQSAIAEHGKVVDKARGFVDEAYSFDGKTTDQVMRDALASEHGKTEFSDAELPLAFRMLKKSSPDYTSFGDSKAEGGLMDRINKTIDGEG